MYKEAEPQRIIKVGYKTLFFQLWLRSNLKWVSRPWLFFWLKRQRAFICCWVHQSAYSPGARANRQCVVVKILHDRLFLSGSRLRAWRARHFLLFLWHYLCIESKTPLESLICVYMDTYMWSKVLNADPNAWTVSRLHLSSPWAIDQFITRVLLTLMRMKLWIRNLMTIYIFDY